MLKGKSTIQLFDAATGAKVLEQSNTNLVTNALELLVNAKERSGLLNWWRDSNVINKNEHLAITPSFAMMPLYKRALGGVLLWDENIAEDPSIVIPPAQVNEVGHAGGPYSSTDVYRGSYNDNESGKIDGGYRHVWDFDTDKANGTVKCLSLTSWHGGNIGYHGCFSGDLYPRYDHCYFHSENYYVSTDYSYHGVKIDDEDKGAVLHLKRMEDGTLRLYRRGTTQIWRLKVPDPSKVGLFNTGLAYTERVVLPITLTNHYAAVYVYKGQLHEVALLSKTQLQHRIFTLEGAQVSSKTLDLPFEFGSANTLNPAFYRDGYYYCFTYSNTCITKITEQGQEVGRIDLPISSSSAVRAISFNDFNGEVTIGIKVGSDSNHVLYTLNARDDLGQVSGPDKHCASHALNTAVPFAQYINTDDPNSPFVFYSDPVSKVIMPLVNTGYLATINNLQTPITKTAAQTMKITYEIYDE